MILVHGGNIEKPVTIAADDIGTVIVILPSKGNFLGITLVASENCPRTLGRVTFQSGPTSRMQFLTSGYMKVQAGITIDAIHWNGRIRLDEGYENKAEARIHNKTGSTLRVMLSAFYETEGK